MMLVRDVIALVLVVTSTISFGCPRGVKGAEYVDGSGDGWSPAQHRFSNRRHPVTGQLDDQFDYQGRRRAGRVNQLDKHHPRATPAGIDNASDEEESEKIFATDSDFRPGSAGFQASESNSRISGWDAATSRYTVDHRTSSPRASPQTTLRPKGRDPLMNPRTIHDTTEQTEPAHSSETSSSVGLPPPPPPRNIAGMFPAGLDDNIRGIVQRLPSELIGYLRILGSSVEPSLMAEFQSIGFSLGPRDEGTGPHVPRHRRICSSGPLEVRSYRPSTFISTTVETASFDVATYVGFHRLFKYIKGDNAKGLPFNMTKPVRTQVGHQERHQQRQDLSAGSSTGGSAGGLEETAPRYTVSFYVDERPRRLPTPLDSRISIKVLEPALYYVLSFDGFPIGDRVHERAQHLARLLPSTGRNGSELLGFAYFVDVYDSPMKLIDRRNEILIKARVNNHPRRWCSKMADYHDMRAEN